MSLNAAESERLVLQEMNEKDHLQGYFWLMNNEEAGSFSLHKPVTTIEQALQDMRDRSPTPEHPWKQRWAIMLKSSVEGEKPKLIGVMGVVREAEIGYRIHPDFQRKGYMPEALVMFLKMWWALPVSKDYNRLLAHVHPDNYGSVQVLVKSGAEKGELKKDTFAMAHFGGDEVHWIQMFYFYRPANE